MLGCGLLIAPVLGRRNRRDIYLPQGECTDIFSGEKYEGGRVIKNTRVPLEAIPVFRLSNNGSKRLDAALANAEPLLKRLWAMKNELREFGTRILARPLGFNGRSKRPFLLLYQGIRGMDFILPPDFSPNIPPIG